MDNAGFKTATTLCAGVVGKPLITDVPMNKVEKDLLNKGIRKYRLGEYSEAEFHKTFETVIGLLTESHLSMIREKFESIEAELEKIDFLSSNKRSDYLIEIERIEQLFLLNIDKPQNE